MIFALLSQQIKLFFERNNASKTRDEFLTIFCALFLYRNTPDICKMASLLNSLLQVRRLAVAMGSPAVHNEESKMSQHQGHQGHQGGGNQGNARNDASERHVAGSTGQKEQQDKTVDGNRLSEQHAAAGSQSHKADTKQTRHNGNNVGTSPNSHTRGGSFEWHSKADRHGDKNEK
jgi:hypothetical protein